MGKWLVLVAVLAVGCAGEHTAPDAQPRNLVDAEKLPSAPQAPEDAGVVQTPVALQDAAPSPAQPQDGGVFDASPSRPDAAQVLTPDAGHTPTPSQSDAGVKVDAQVQVDAGNVSPDASVQQDAAIVVPDAGSVQPDASAPPACTDEVPVHPTRTLVGGAPFDCTDSAECTGAVSSSALEALWCDPGATIAVGTGTQVRWFGYGSDLPTLQVPRSACVRIIASGFCSLRSSFLSPTQDPREAGVIKYASAPQGAANVEGWVEVDVSATGALACDLSCAGMPAL